MSKDKYYVYQVTLGKEILYIGKGKGNRYKHATSGRSHSELLNEKWFRYKLIGEEKPVVKILEYFKEDKDSLEKEKELIVKYSPVANKLKGTIPKPLYLTNPFAYHHGIPESPSYSCLWHPEGVTQEVFNDIVSGLESVGSWDYSALSKLYSEIHDLEICTEYITQLEVYMDRIQMCRLE